MTDAMMSAAAAMAANEQHLDVATRNIVNSQTPGWMTRVSTTTGSFDAALQQAGGGLQARESIAFVPGTLIKSDSPTAVALPEMGFFEINTPDGVAYTRNGDFVFGDDGRLQTRSGLEVAGRSGAIKRLSGGAVEIDTHGVARQGGREIGRLRVVDFDTKSELRPISDTLFTAGPKAGLKVVNNPAVAAGHLEYASDRTVGGLIQMISIQRNYDAAQRVLTALADSYDRLTRSQA